MINYRVCNIFEPVSIFINSEKSKIVRIKLSQQICFNKLHELTWLPKFILRTLIWLTNHEGLEPELSCHTRTLSMGPMSIGMERMNEIMLPRANGMYESPFNWYGRLAPCSPSNIINALAVVPELRQIPVDTSIS